MVGFLFRYMYDPTGGLIPWLLTTVGVPIPKVGLLGSGATALPSILFADMWQWTPFFAIVLYAALLSVPHHVVEAAPTRRRLVWTMLRRIRLPLIRKTLSFVLMLRFMQLFNTFDLVLVLTRGGPGLVHAHPRLHALSTGTCRLQYRPRQRYDLDYRDHGERVYRALRLLRLQGLGVGRCARASIASGRALIYAGLLLVLLVFVGPILWFVLLAIRPSETVFAVPPVLLFKPSPAAFQATFLDPGINRHQLFNSLIVAGGAVLLNLPFSFPAAYALSRFRIRGRKNIMLWYLGLLMAPPVAFLIPYSCCMSRIGSSGSYLAMILIMQTITIPFSVWLMKSFIDEVPVELEEAARVDGAKWHRVIFGASRYPWCGPD